MKPQLITIKRLQDLQESISYLEKIGVDYKSIYVTCSQEDKSYKDIIVYDDTESEYLTALLHELADVNVRRAQIIKILKGD